MKKITFFILICALTISSFSQLKNNQASDYGNKSLPKTNVTNHISTNYIIPGIIESCNDYQNESFLIQPTTNKDVFSIETTLSISKLSIHNLTGECITQNYDLEQEINLADLEQGIYYIKCYTSQKTYTFQFQKA